MRSHWNRRPIWLPPSPGVPPSAEASATPPSTDPPSTEACAPGSPPAPHATSGGTDVQFGGWTRCELDVLKH